MQTIPVTDDVSELQARLLEAQLACVFALMARGMNVRAAIALVALLTEDAANDAAGLS